MSMSVGKVGVMVDVIELIVKVMMRVRSRFLWGRCVVNIVIVGVLMMIFVV